jgi:Fe-S cluster assembly ATP-binding protein
MSEPLFEIDDLTVVARALGDGARGIDASEQSEPIPVLAEVSLTIEPGELHALLGPPGAGKSTLAATLLGSPRCDVIGGRILLKGDDITDWAPDARNKAGVFLAFQNPDVVPGLSVLSFLRQALSARSGIEMNVPEFRSLLTDWMGKLGIDPSFVERPTIEGLSEREKKQNEVLQMAMLEPAIAILDETQAGLDPNDFVAVADGIRAVLAERHDLGVLTLAPDERIVDHIGVDRVHVLIDGRIVASGGCEIARQVARDGYESFR